MASPQFFTRIEEAGDDTRGARSHRTVLTAIVVVGFCTSLVACASLGPSTPVAVSGVKAGAGTWKGVVYRRGFEATLSDNSTLSARLSPSR